MVEIIKKNRLFFTFFVFFLTAGGFYLKISDKTAAILYFNQHRSPLLDIIFKLTTLLGEAWLYLLCALIALTYKLRHALLISFTGLSCLLLSYTLKSFFQEDRPLTYFKKMSMEDQLRLVAGVDVHTGATSLPSGHTMAAFALYSLLAFLIPVRKHLLALPFFSLAFGVGLSRMYLIQHYWVDVYWGAIAGTTLAIIMYQLNERLAWHPAHVLEKPVFRNPFNTIR